MKKPQVALILLVLMLSLLTLSGGDQDKEYYTLQSKHYMPGPGINLSPRAVTSRVEGVKDPLILCVEFDDVHGTKPMSQYETILTGMDDYFNEVSYNKLSINGTVGPQWYRSLHNMAYYGADGATHDSMNGPVSDLVKDAADLADGDINFSDYDHDSNGYVDNVIIVHSGNDQAESGVGNDIWSHKATISGGHTVDGVIISDYTMLAETSPLGTFVHEFAHDLGMPDLYDYGYESDGIGQWGLMGMGSYLNYGQTPVHICGWGKVHLGWIDPIVVDDILLQETIPCIEKEPVVYKLPISSTEYFLVENRQQEDFDLYLPGRGLLITHIDETRWSSDTFDPKHWRPNEDEDHKFVDVEESTVVQNLDLGVTESDNNTGDFTDPWFNSVSGFSFFSDPGSSSYYAPGTDTIISVTNISKRPQTGTDMVADLAVNRRSLSLDCGDILNVGLAVGESTEFLFECQSNRKAGDNLTLERSGTNIDWGVFNTTTLTTGGPADEKKFKLRVTAPLDALSGEKATISVKFQNQEGYISNYINVAISVDARFEVGFSEIPQQVFYNQQMTPANVKVFNYGNYQTQVKCVVDAPKDFTAEVVPETFNISAFSNSSININIIPNENARGGQNYTFTLKAELTDETNRYNDTEFTGMLTTRRGLVFGLESSVDQLQLGVDNHIFFNISNLGNIGEEVSLSFDMNGTEDWGFQFESDLVSLAPGSTRSNKLTINTPSDAIYREEGAPLSIAGTSKDFLVTEYLNTTLFLHKIYLMEVELDKKVSKIRMDPEGKQNVTLVISNLGNVFDEVEISAQGEEGLLATLSTYELTITPGADTKFNITLKAEFGAHVGDLNLSVNITSKTNSSYWVLTNLIVTIQPTTQLQISLTNTHQDENGITHFKPGEILDFKLTIQNVGNFIETVKLSANVSSDLGKINFYDEDGNPVTRASVGMGESRVFDVDLVVSHGTKVEEETVVLIVMNSQGRTDTAEIHLEKKEDSGTSVFLIAGLVGLALIIIIVIIVILVLIMKKRGGEKEGLEEPVPEEQTQELTEEEERMRAALEDEGSFDPAEPAKQEENLSQPEVMAQPEEMEAPTPEEGMTTLPGEQEIATPEETVDPDLEATPVEQTPPGFEEPVGGDIPD